MDSYSGQPGNNKFTKVKMDVAADESLRWFFKHHSYEIDAWFNVISPRSSSIAALKQDLSTLTSKAR